MEQQLNNLKHILAPLDLSGALDQHVLYPGNRRQQLMRGLMSRLLAGLTVEEVALPDTVQPELSEDERFAERCRVLLQMFNIQATADQIRGCSGNEQQDTHLLIKVAQLLQAVQQQQSNERTAATNEALPQLLCSASENLGQLTTTTIQLFASDFNDVLKARSDQGTLQKQARYQQQLEVKKQQLQQQLQQMLTGGGSDCQQVGDDHWRRLLTDTEAGLDELLQEVQNFEKVYQQDLSVWADAANRQEQVRPGAGHKASHNSLDVANSVGQAAQHIVTAYKGLTAALEGFEAIKKQHQALQDVPVAILQQQQTVHKHSTAELNQAAAVLKQ